MSKFVQAVKDKVIVEIIEQDNKTAGGIIVPDSVEKDPQLYTRVISVGEEVKGIEVGDTVLCHRQGGMDIMMDRKILKVLKIEEVYGILKDEK